ncbi:MAG: GNAT family N-acetyltransferase [Opitutaceae bacterium]|nr:GNAT family N-acetyltransferase [Opitutaceae bacterium]
MSPTDHFVTRAGDRVGVRRLGAGDVAALPRFFAGLAAATRAVFLPHATDTATLARCIERDQRGLDRAYVLDVDGGIVGYFFLWEFDQPVPLLGLGLADAWQGRGLGDQMLARLIADARSAGRTAVELTTVPGNTRALAVYQRAGFVHVGDVENVAGDGRIVREHRMFLPLQPGARPPERHFGPPA